ncbi:hypothetical protein DFJ58DRAFT_837196 [Suillus subalutaceus]|uniref:uncharacterized protein n=1 Tax=Suillus subalutaceus TaxID=48586 RepID=UPI001B86F50F|nr:uncharacterized protein DFJ58DRAFT_837196 [Suillus subalutaceus]KAG1871223.1 hypothetical protein DFJ58DRAFT_837196 [Suillus subalutaceus]
MDRDIIRLLHICSDSGAFIFAAQLRCDEHEVAPDERYGGLICVSEHVENKLTLFANTVNALANDKSLNIFYSESIAVAHRLVTEAMSLPDEPFESGGRQPTIFELLKTSGNDCAFIFIEHQNRSNTHVYIETSDKMKAALKANKNEMIYTESPPVIATNAVYDDGGEFDRIANLISNNPGTSVVYAESLALARDLVHFAFTGELINKDV